MLKEMNKFFYDFIFPSIDRIMDFPKVAYDINAIMFKNILLYAKIGAGKTELVRKIDEEAVKKYGEENVNAVKTSKGKLLSLLDYGLTDTLVQILFCDDLSTRKMDPYVLNEYFSIRHQWKETINRDYGYILSILATHRFHNTPTGLRTNIDVMLAKNAPTNPYDKNIMKKYFGEKGLLFLQEMELKIEKDEAYKRYSLFNIYDTVGILDTPMAQKNYLREVKSPSYYKW